MKKKMISKGEVVPGSEVVTKNNIFFWGYESFNN